MTIEELIPVELLHRIEQPTSYDVGNTKLLPLLLRHVELHGVDYILDYMLNNLYFYDERRVTKQNDN